MWWIELGENEPSGFLKYYFLTIDVVYLRYIGDRQQFRWWSANVGTYPQATSLTLQPYLSGGETDHCVTKKQGFLW